MLKARIHLGQIQEQESHSGSGGGKIRIDCFKMHVGPKLHADTRGCCMRGRDPIGERP